MSFYIILIVQKGIYNIVGDGNLNEMQLLKLGFTAVPNMDVKLPDYLCGTVRGAFGYALADCCCTKQNIMCEYCDDICAYSSIFKNSKNTALPYVIEASEGGFINSGETISFSITLIGSGCLYSKIVIDAVKQMMKQGFARKNAEFKVVSIKELLTDTVIEENGVMVNDIVPYIWTDENHSEDNVNGARIEFETPFNIRGCSNMEFTDFVTLLFARISELMINYCGSEFYLPYRLISRIPYVTVDTCLKGAAIKFESKIFKGRVGKIDYRGEIGEYMPYIRLGELIHFGKTITRGFGKYTAQGLYLI